MKLEKRSFAELLAVIVTIAVVTATVVAGPTPKGVVPAPSPHPITVKLTTDRSTYAPGNEAKIAITVDKSCYLYLYDIGTDGTVTLLFPNRFQPNSRFGPGTLSLPGKGYKFVVAGPEGEETLVAVAAVAPIPLLVPDKKAPFRAFKLTPVEFANKLVAVLPHGGYSTAWLQVHVYQPRAVVVVNSTPEGAKIYVNGRYAGVTPKVVIVPAGESTITLEKSGFAPYSRTVTLADRTAAEIAARLQTAPLTPPTSGIGVPISGFVGVDLGTNSIGGEAGFGHIGITGGMLFSTDPWLAGPEVLLGIRVHVTATPTFGVVIGGGIAIQERYVVLPTAVAPADIVIKPETNAVILPDVVIGIEIHLDYGFLFAGYDLRRGPIGGIGLSF